MRATPLPCLLYNNPPAYGTDFLPDQIEELAREIENFRAVKESSGDIRRVTAIRALCGPRLEVLVGLDDAVVEGVAAGATGWVAGLANALPRESVELFNRAREGERSSRELYRWFLPLLRLDCEPKFVQLIKLVQEAVGCGTARVRPPRLELAGAELEAARALIAASLDARPASGSK
jgi:4-hydroxy-tetrahydrodipicolinate synthase